MSDIVNTGSLSSTETTSNGEPNDLNNNCQILATGDIVSSTADKSIVCQTIDGSGDDVTQIARSLTKTLTIESRRRFAKRPAPKQLATNDKLLTLVSNCFPLILKDMVFYHYDIDIILVDQSDTGYVAITDASLAKKMRKLGQKDNMEIIEKFAEECPEVFDKKPFVFDGLKNLYTNLQLNLKGKQLVRKVTIALKGFAEQCFQVAIQLTNEKSGLIREIKMSTIGDYLNNKLEDIPEDALHVLEIILRYNVTKSCIPVGRSLYPIVSETEDIGQNACVAYGHYQSVHMTESGPALVIDRTATLFRTAGKLTKFVMGLMAKKVKSIDEIDFNPEMITKLSKQLSGIRISTQHTGGKRHSVIDSLSDLRPKDIEFNLIIKKNKVKTNVLDYFENQYNTTLKYPNLPCVQIKGGVARYLPIELCDVSSNQPILRRHTTPSMTASLIRKCGQQRPEQRFEFVEHTTNSIVDKSSDLLTAMGISLSTIPIQVKGRVLRKPECSGSDRRVLNGKQLSQWYLISMAYNFCADYDWKVKAFVLDLQNEAKRMGLIVANPQIEKHRYSNDQTQVKNILQEKVSLKLCPQLILFAIPYGDGTYHKIKLLADNRFGLMTQCVKIDHIMRTPRGCLTNLLLKINAKLSGQNCIVMEKEWPSSMKKMMIIGADVTHPAPADAMHSSVAAVVASYDPFHTKYMTSLRVQRRSKDEMINRFQEMIEEMLNHYKQTNKQLPEGLILFRDGVSQGQFRQVLDHEFQQMRAACAQVQQNYAPKITFIIVQKRHHMRFKPLDPNNDLVRNMKSGNIPAGTVVDTTVVDPIMFEYYLCSHTGLMGTSRPAKYVVLHDDHEFSFNQMERLSYQLCYSYVRSSNSISVPIPVMYAHLAAKRAKDHIIAINRQSVNTRYLNETIEDREDGIAKRLNDKIKVMDSLSNQFYYC
ncbi:protein argonaute-2-like [Oppia nitens]|uniref:protein argonaute-2-like n=1 Tax=Oppia nitens TaxID=1686743 RepID=UPI0023DBA75A|nr:protein argonaute-2-like [Oppia nitens]